MRKNSIKNTRINAEVQKELSNILREGIKDPRVAPMTSVVAVEVAPDLKTCKAYISVLGDEKAQEDTIKGLQSAEGYIRRELARGLNMRNTPEVKFVLDQSIAYGVAMSKKIDEVTKDIKEEGEKNAFKGIGTCPYSCHRRTYEAGWGLHRLLYGCLSLYSHMVS